jgi:rubrerythrin
MVSEEVKKMLEDGFSTEARASNLYYFFARKADEEVSFAPSAEVADMLKEAAILFRQIAEEEAVHAYVNLAAMDGISDTIQNLQKASAMETLEYRVVFPLSAAVLEMEGNQTVASQLRAIGLAEKRHAERFDQLLKRLTESWLDKRLNSASQD